MILSIKVGGNCSGAQGGEKQAEMLRHLPGGFWKHPPRSWKTSVPITPPELYSDYPRRHRIAALWAGAARNSRAPTGSGVFSDNGQEGDQFPKVNCEFSHFDLWCRRLAAAHFSSLRVEDSLTYLEARVFSLLKRLV